MSIETTYRTIFTEDYIKDQLSRGTIVSATDVAAEVETLINDSDLSVPQFDASPYHITRNQSSSASLFQNTFNSIRQDMRALYKELINLNNVNKLAFERWNLEATSIEKSLIDLEERIDNLLLLTQDTDGYNFIFVDNFTDTKWIDIANSTIEHDIESSTIEMSETNRSATTRIFLNQLNEVDDVTFKVRTTVDQLNRVDAVNSSLTDMFNQENKAWWTSVNMRVQKPVTCELTVRLTSEDPIEISRIFMELHDSSESSPINVTPLYSTDNRNWNQLPTNTFTLEVRTSATFSFTPVEAKWVRFLLTKLGPDPSSSEKYFSYQFGFKKIDFYNQSFSALDISQFISNPIFITSTEGVVQEFEKILLETCERLETDTQIDYYITTSNDPTVPLDSDKEPTDGTWAPISPVQRTEKLHTNILNVGDAVDTTIGDTEENTTDDEVVTVSYNGYASDTDFVNPAASFTVLAKDPSSGNITQQSRTAGSEIRYVFINSNERILSHQIKIADAGVAGSAINFDQNQITLFRNVGAKGFLPGDTSQEVRGIQRGWKFEDPYYSCVVEIINPDGIEINVGDSPIIIDGVKYTNLVDSTILTGKTGVAGSNLRDSGIHTISVHKDNWLEVTPDLNTLAALKSADPLYPYNHKLLVEGYSYGTSYPSNEDKIYQGVDLFAAQIAQQVSIFDLTSNIPVDGYGYFAVDKDGPKTHDTPYDNNSPTLVLVVKIDEENPDFQNERFVIRFKLINELRKYLRLRADLSTENTGITPALHSYKLKLG